MERSKFTAGIAGFIALIILVISILTMSLCLGIRKNVKNTLFSGKDDVAAIAGADDENKTRLYSAVLSEDKIYIYDASGKLDRTVNAYAEFLTDSDRALLSDGIDFYSEEEMLSFMTDFEG